MTLAATGLAVGLLLIAGCADEGPPGAAEGAGAARPLTGTVWRLASMDGTALAPASPDVLLEFGEENRLMGNAGCNTYTGGWRRNGDSLYVTALASTRKACVDAAVMARESAFLEALEQARTVELGENGLSIGTGGEAGTLVFAPVAGG